MPPEQARGRWELVDHQSDLYSFGATLFTLLTGRIVYEHAGTVAELMVLSITEDPQSLRTLMPDAPAALVRAIDRSLKRAKSERWLDAAEMRAELERAHAALIASSELTARAEQADERAFEQQSMPAISAWRMPRIASLAFASSNPNLPLASSATESTSVSPERDMSEQTNSAMVATSASAPVATLAPSIAATSRTPASSSALTPRIAPTQSRYTAIYDRRH